MSPTRQKWLVVAMVISGAALATLASAQIIETESTVTKVIVYNDCAQISRQADLEVKEGFNEVVFTNVPERLKEDTLSVSARGTAPAKILDAKIKTIFLEKPQSEKIRELQNAIRALENNINGYNGQQGVINEEREFLKSVRLHANQQIPEDLVTKMPKTEDLNSWEGFIRDRWQDTFTRELEIKEKIKDASEKLDALRRELSQINQAAIKEKRIISVALEVEKAGTLNVMANYLISQAGWKPEYDARVNYEQQKVELVCAGIVIQKSGQDWKGVEVTLSTSKPTISGKMPELKSWWLRPYAPPRPLYTAQGEAVSNRLMREKAAVCGAGMPLASQDKKQELDAEELFAQSEELPTSVNYKIARLVDIKSDGTEHRLPVFSRTFETNFQYTATPKLSPFAYLTAKVVNNEDQLLPAAVRVFLDGVYIGSSAISTVGKGEKLELYLGIDEGVKVKREKIKEEVKEVWIAGIKRNNKVVVLTYKITVENYKSKDIKIDLFDHMPVSQSDQIAVKVLELQPKPQEEGYKDRKGVMRWEFDIRPKGKSEVVLTYQVEYPRDMDIRL
jgi:uncharacterized protein (TIGR02231 family)